MEEPWQAISRPSTSSQRCYHLHLADRPTWLPGRHGGQLQKLHWLHEYDERWPAQPVPFSSLIPLKFWSMFQHNKNCRNTFIEHRKERNLPFSHSLIHRKDTSELSPPKAGSPHVTTLSSILMAAKAPSLGTTCWTSTSPRGLWLRRPPHVTTVPSSLMAVKAASVARICRTPLRSLALKNNLNVMGRIKQKKMIEPNAKDLVKGFIKNQETFKQPWNKISQSRWNRMKDLFFKLTKQLFQMAGSISACLCWSPDYSTSVCSDGSKSPFTGRDLYDILKLVMNSTAVATSAWST